MELIRSALLTLLVLTLVSTAAAQAGLTVKVGEVSGAPGQRAEVPIQVIGTSNVGSLHIELVYDPAVLQPVEKRDGALASGALVEARFDIPGRVVLGLISAQGINGNGEIAAVSFDVLGKDGATSALTLENARANDATTLADIPTAVENGTFRVGAGPVFPVHLILFGVAGVAGLAFFALLLFLLVRRRKPGPVAPPVPPPARPVSPPGHPEELLSRRPPARPKGPPERLGGGKPSGPPETLD